MPLNKINIRMAYTMIGTEHTKCVVKLSKQQIGLENKWHREAANLHEKIVKQISDQLAETGRIKIPVKIFEEFLLSHYFSVVESAADSVDSELSVIAPVQAKLAKKPTRPLIPKSLGELRAIYDNYRKTGRLPKGFRDKADELKSWYLKKTQNAWKKYSDDFRNGDAFTQENVLRKVRAEADVVESRAKTIVRTETTNYYNETRREMYDQSDLIWGYLFLAIRDQGTTKWCTDKVRGGKRGRHGLVYKKGDPLTAKETPSCHWNCRSDMVPLTIYNPRHRKLIEDETLHRRNHECHPLPTGWR